MDLSLLISLCLIMVPAISSASTIASSPDPSLSPVQICNTDASFQNNSMFQRNLNSLLKDLLNDTPCPSKLTKEHVQGSHQDKVYGYSQCFFTSLSQPNCSLCIKRAVNQTRSLCQNAITVTILYDECLVSYGDRKSKMIVGVINEHMYAPDSQFKQNLNKVWSMLNLQASRTENPVAFAYGSTPNLVFGFAQCHNLTSDCAGSFNSNLQSIGSPLGARVITPDFFIRYENSSFFTGGIAFQILASTQSPLGSPVAAPSPSNYQPLPKRSFGRHLSAPGLIFTAFLGGACAFMSLGFRV